MDIALIGFPQSGKTTLLSSLTRGRAETGTYGSAKQEVHTGIARLPDRRLNALSSIFNPAKVVHVEMKYSDVPGGSRSTGEAAGIGGQFLNLLQSADALLHVVRAFEDPSVPHIEGGVDPQRDSLSMESELAFSDLAILERRTQRIEEQLKGTRSHDRDIVLKEGSLLQRLKEGLEEGVPVRRQQVSREENDMLSNYQLLTAKPLLTVLNVDEATTHGEAEPEEELDSRHQQGPWVKATRVCAKLEMELSQLAPDDEREFRESMGLQESGTDRVIAASYDLLSLVSFFTYVSKEVRAWAVPAGAPAAKAAGHIHSDMERGFIRAEVIAFDDLARCGSVAQCRKEGLLRLEGKNYEVKDGDVITFLFNV